MKVKVRPSKVPAARKNIFIICVHFVFLSGILCARDRERKIASVKKNDKIQTSWKSPEEIARALNSTKIKI